MSGNKNQNKIIIENHKAELNKNATGEIFLKKNNAAEINANTFTKIINTFISFLLIK